MTITAAEQLLMELINRARLDPLAEAARFGIDLNDGIRADRQIGPDAMQVLAHNTALQDASQAHSEWMLEVDLFQHEGVSGSSAGQRMNAAGYSFEGRSGWGENIAFTGSTGSIDLNAAMIQHYDGLFLSAGHRANTLNENFQEIGIAQVQGLFTHEGREFNASMLTENFAMSGSQAFVTGVAYSDVDGDAFYGIGEGLGGYWVEADGSRTVTASAGGYAVQAELADVTVSVGFGDETYATLVLDLSGGNGKLDLVIDEDGDRILLLSASARLESGIGEARLLGSADLDLTGNRDANVLIGNHGDNRLDDGGGSGRDILRGGEGDDIYIVRSANTRIDEWTGTGFDQVAASADFALSGGDSIELLTTTSSRGTRDIDLRGNGQTQTIRGNDGDNVLHTGGGTLNRLIGGQGDDTFRVFHGTDDVVERAGGGHDRILSAVTYRLEEGDYVETLATNGVAGLADINLYGNELAQTIRGNGGDNVLSDGGGAGDWMRGYGGDDTYFVASSDTEIVERAGEGGRDRVAAAVDYQLGEGVAVEHLTTNTSRGEADIALIGNELRQTLRGNMGDNWLDSGDGRDTLIGGDGADSFVFTTELGTSSFDTIQDMTLGEDRIVLDNAIFQGLAEGTLDSDAFAASERGRALDADDRILYSSETGYLYYDRDGSGEAGRQYFGRVDAGLDLTADDFLII